MVLILEGIDNVGKSTQIRNIQPLLTDLPVFFLHYMAIKGLPDSESTKEYSSKTYSSMFNLIKNNRQLYHFVLDRAHIGEVVYSPMYRGYSGDYVYDLEKAFLDKDLIEETYLITFVDKPENVISRDDGESFSTKLEQKQREIDAFVNATERSSIKNKIVINIDGKDIPAVFDIIRSFIQR